MFKKLNGINLVSNIKRYKYLLIFSFILIGMSVFLFKGDIKKQEVEAAYPTNYWVACMPLEGQTVPVTTGLLGDYHCEEIEEDPAADCGETIMTFKLNGVVKCTVSSNSYT